MKNKPASPARDPKGMDWRTIWNGLGCWNALPDTKNTEISCGLLHFMVSDKQLATFYGF